MPKIQMRRDTAANWKSVNPTLLAGEWALETDTRLMKIGDGTTAYNALPYSTAEDSEEWQKPDDWIDIRSGALSNSVYFLVGHSADFSKYNMFGLQATVSSSGTYDVYIDGIKKYTTNNEQNTMINWQTLALSSGWDVTYPEALRVHIVRVTPSLSTNSITAIKHKYNSAGEECGTLWVHFNIDNAISLADFARTQFNSTDGNGYLRILQAVTSNKDTLVVTSLNSSFQGCSGLQTVPTFEGNNMNVKTGARAFSSCTSLNLINLKNILLTSDQVFWNATKLKKINCENAFVIDNGYIFAGCQNLTELPTISSTGASSDYFLQGCSNLRDTFLDFSQNANKTLINLRATSSSRVDGLKGITVCPEAPFTGASPQINVSYTGLDRQALVNLFKSMPYNVGYEVVGSPTIVDGVVSGFSSSDYLQIQTPLPSADITSYKFRTKVIIPAVTTGSQRIFSYRVFPDALDSLFYRSNGKITWNAVRMSGSTDVSMTTTATFSQGEEVIIECGYKGDNVFMLRTSADNGSTWAEVNTTATTTINNLDVNTYLTFGRSYPSQQDVNAFDGSIDLNETYININGVPWFTGKEAMTKTCNIVGCTGTADLTQEDKNIALDKGWELTVA